MKIKHRDEVLTINPYIPGKPIDQVQEEFGLTDIIKLASNENPLGASPRARQAMVKQVESAHIYPDGNCNVLKEGLAQHLDIAKEQLIIGNGSDEVLKFIGETFLQPDDEVIMADPTFSEYQFVSRLMGAKERLVPLQNDRHDLSEMARHLNERTKVIFICNPNNPTGTIVTQDELVAFLQDVPNDVLVVIDEAYYEYVTDTAYPASIPLLAKYSNVIITRTFSKVYGLAALRIGYGIARQEIISLLERTREPFNVNSMAQVAAVASLLDPAHVVQSTDLCEQGKSYLYDQFKRLEISYIPTEANFILFDTGQDAFAVFNQLLKRGVIVRSAHVFGMPTFIRVTVGTHDQNRRFITALEEVLADEDSY